MWTQKTYSQIIDHLNSLSDLKLPGSAAHKRLAPIGRTPELPPGLNLDEVKRAAVLMLLVDTDNRPELILTKRTEYEGVHSGQISLPGGKKETSDSSFLDTALRETHEEIGIPSSRIDVITEMSELYIPPSNFLVQPFLGIMNHPTPFIAEESEVQEIISIDLNKLFDPKTLGVHRVKVREYHLKVPAYEVHGHVIWGATAMMLSELHDLLN